MTVTTTMIQTRRGHIIHVKRGQSFLHDAAELVLFSGKPEDGKTMSVVLDGEAVEALRKALA